MTLVLRPGFLLAIRLKSVAQTMSTTWCQEIKKKSPTTRQEGLHVNRRKRALQVNRNCALKTPLRPSIQADQFLWALQQLASNSNFAGFNNNIH